MVNRQHGGRSGRPWRPAWGYTLLALALLGGSGWLLLGLQDDAGVVTSPTPPAAASASAAPMAEWNAAASAAPVPDPALAGASSPAPPAASRPSDDLDPH